MHIKLGLQWYADANRKLPLDNRLLPLLREIDQAGSITLAASNIDVSYRFAWGLIREWEKRLNQTLIITGHGRKQGAHLTEFSRTLLLEDSEIHDHLLPLLDEHAARINTSLNSLDQAHTQGEIRIFASHDLVMNILVEDISSRADWNTSHEVRGSLNNLRALANHDCEIAGFHFPVDFIDSGLVDRYRHYLKLAHAACVHVAVREQGLIVQKGNPKNIRSIRDLTRRSVRFINRQSQSGTRILFDAMLRHESLKPSRINGYVNEEFTHVAVAAMVASGAANAGMGLKAAAKQFHLDFIPLVHERYCLALSPHLENRIKSSLKKRLAATAFRRKGGAIAGYELTDSGKDVPLNRLFA